MAKKSALKKKSKIVAYILALFFGPYAYTYVDRELMKRFFAKVTLTIALPLAIPSWWLYTFVNIGHEVERHNDLVFKENKKLNIPQAVSRTRVR